MSALSGQAITHLMRHHKVTIVGLAHRMNITQKRVREARVQGVKGEHYVRDWREGIEGQPSEKQADLL